VWKTWQEIYDIVDLFTRGKIYLLTVYLIGMHALNLCPDNSQDGSIWNFLGIFSKNREEWAVADIACIRSSVTIVPFFDSLGAGALEFVMKQTEVSSMCVDQGGIDLLLKVKLQCPTLKNIVTFDDTP
jgi:long-chain acyl-CoA synthetase